LFSFITLGALCCQNGVIYETQYFLQCFYIPTQKRNAETRFFPPVVREQHQPYHKQTNEAISQSRRSTNRSRLHTESLENFIGDEKQRLLLITAISFTLSTLPVLAFHMTNKNIPLI
jgi:hypothetical protein